MINRLLYIATNCTNPYQNLAVEEYLRQTVAADEIILFLWQNKKTVVVGRNQNARRECNLALLEYEGGCLARRLSGGGAVFHDLGNQNFSFIAQDNNYSVARQLEVIIRAFKAIGIKAEKTGRNDIVTEGRKCVGNAFLSKDGKNCHHGAILYDVKIDDLSKYLTVSQQKLQAKGVQSVRSRVINLKEVNQNLTLKELQNSLKSAFCDEYALPCTDYVFSAAAKEKIAALAEFFASENYRFGKDIAFGYELSQRFNWGEIQIQIQVGPRTVRQAKIYSDALETELIASLSELLVGCEIDNNAFAQAIEKAEIKNNNEKIIIDELTAWLRNNNDRKEDK